MRRERSARTHTSRTRRPCETPDPAARRGPASSAGVARRRGATVFYAPVCAPLPVDPKPPRETPCDDDERELPTLRDPRLIPLAADVDPVVSPSDRRARAKGI